MTTPGKAPDRPPRRRRGGWIGASAVAGVVIVLCAIFIPSYVFHANEEEASAEFNAASQQLTPLIYDLYTRHVEPINNIYSGRRDSMPLAAITAAVAKGGFDNISIGNDFTPFNDHSVMVSVFDPTVHHEDMAQALINDIQTDPEFAQAARIYNQHGPEFSAAMFKLVPGKQYDEHLMFTPSGATGTTYKTPITGSGAWHVGYGHILGNVLMVLQYDCEQPALYADVDLKTCRS